MQDPSLALSENQLDGIEKIGLGLIASGAVMTIVALFGVGMHHPGLLFAASVGLAGIGALIYIRRHHGKGLPGVRNNGIMRSSLLQRGAFGWMLAVVLTGFYICMYWYPQSIWNLVKLFDGLSNLLRGRNADQYFLYSALYSILVFIMGYRALLKYRHNRYQILRTLNVSFFQIGFAFLFPSLIQKLNQPEWYFHYFWPLDYKALFPGKVSALMHHPGGLGKFMFFWGAMMTFVGTPLLTWRFGKRWYCSWVCGCGGLAETMGDPFRQLSDKSLKAWRLERVLIHSVLVFVSITTLLLVINSAMEGRVLGHVSQQFAKVYGFAIGSVFAGVVGTGFYPLLGNRAWCRFGCPMAAILGLLQKKVSRFRITVNGAQCISCGNCSTYCEMGIDVRWYAQRGQNVIRNSCVGCGICANVCPRGVLALENGPVKGRYNDAHPLVGLSKSGVHLKS